MQREPKHSNDRWANRNVTKFSNYNCFFFLRKHFPNHDCEKCLTNFANNILKYPRLTRSTKNRSQLVRLIFPMDFRKTFSILPLNIETIYLFRILLAHHQGPTTIIINDFDRRLCFNSVSISIYISLHQCEMDRSVSFTCSCCEWTNRTSSQQYAASALVASDWGQTFLIMIL